MNLYEQMTQHRSIRKYEASPIPDTDLHEILEAAIHGPTSINGQQWSVIVVKDPEKKKKLAELTGGQPWIAECPVFLLFIMDYYKINEQMKARQLPMDHLSSVEAIMVGSVDVGIAFGTAMTLAESMGYGVVPIGAVRREPYEVIEMFDLPQGTYPVLGMCLGKPAEMPGLKPRLPYETVVHEERYNKDTADLVNAYDAKIRAYMDERTGGQEVHTWSDRVCPIYNRVYFPKVKGSLKQQGFTNEN